jgi:hypothetical protein
MRINLGDVNLWFDVSGPSVAPDGATVIERPTLVAVHGGPGTDHINIKAGLAPLSAGTVAVTIAPPSFGTCGPGPVTSSSCATCSAWSSRW